MGYHLPVVFPRGFSIEKKNQMNIEGYLQKIVPLDNAGQGYVRVTCPEVRGKVVVNVLQQR
jgi:hypothetical protein